MRTKIVSIALICVVVAGCDLLPQKPYVYTASELAESDNLRLCRIIGWSYWTGNPGAYQLAAAELHKRNAFNQDCVNIAQIEINSYENNAKRDQARSQALADALAQISRDAQERAKQPIYQPSPNVNCTSYTQAGVTQTNCH